MTFSNAMTYRMPAGIPGAISRAGGGVVMDVEPVALSSASPLAAYGLFGQLDNSGDFRALAAGDAAVYGLLSRPFPANDTTATGFFGQDKLGTPAVPPQNGGDGGVLRSGYMTVALEPNNAGVTAAVVKGGVVYACIQNPNAVGHVGGVQGAADGGNTIATKWIFMGPADANGNVEIANLGNNY